MESRISTASRQGARRSTRDGAPHPGPGGALRIGVDVREWRAGTSTGIARVLTGLLDWAGADSAHRFVLFGNQHTEMERAGDGVERVTLREGSRLWWDQVGLPRALRRADVDVFLSPYYKGPLRAPCPVVVTANDLIDLHFPRSGALARRALRSWMRIMLRRATHVLTLSEYSRRDIVETLGIDPARVSAFPLAIEKRFFEPANASQIATVRSRYGIPRDYVLYVGRYARHKNVDTLLSAWKGLAAARRERFALVLAGRDVESFRAAAARFGVEAITPGLIGDEGLAGLYAGATLMCFPSLYEGFGLPPLEAMACGTTVVASNAASMPEVLGDAALLLDPLDEDAWTAALERLLADQHERARLVARGTARARSYTPERSGTAMLDCLVRAAASGAA